MGHTGPLFGGRQGLILTGTDTSSGHAGALPDHRASTSTTLRAETVSDLLNETPSDIASDPGTPLLEEEMWLLPLHTVLP